MSTISSTQVSSHGRISTRTHKHQHIALNSQTILHLAYPLSSVFFIGKTSLVYGGIAFGFSMLGVILPDAFLVGNPLEVSGITPEHIIGHIMWGLVAGVASFSFRYAILS